MAKRMIETGLWNDENVIEHFTAEDKYFWLYILTSPRINICGIFKSGTALIAREMGLHTDTIDNLIYRFENTHHRIATDTATNEIVVLNWYKYNWSKSPKLRVLIEKEAAKIESNTIQKLIQARIKAFFDGDTLSIPYPYPIDTVSIPYGYPMDTLSIPYPRKRKYNNSISNNNSNNNNNNSISNNNSNNNNNNSISNNNSNNNNNNSNSLIESNSNNNTVIVGIEEISKWFDIIYAIYPRKVSKIQAKRTFEKKLSGLELGQAQKKVKAIKHMLEAQCAVWKKENNGEGRQLEYIPHFSTWLNANIEDSVKFKGGRRT